MLVQEELERIVVGVKGDARVYEQVCALRVVSSLDAMTADWELLPAEVLQRISNRILNEVEGFARVWPKG